MLGLEDLSPGAGVLPVVEAMAVRELVAVVIGLLLLHLQAVVPGIEQRDLGAAVVLHVTLAADHGPHLLARGQGIGIVGRRPVALAPGLDGGQVRHRLAALGQDRDAAEEAGLGDPELHVLGIVAVDATQGVLGLLGRFKVGQLAHGLEALHDLRLALGAEEGVVQAAWGAGLQPRLPVEHSVGGVALEAGTGLRLLGHAPGLALVVQHEGMAATPVVVDGEGIAIEDDGQAGVLLQLADGEGLAPGTAILGSVLFAGLDVAVILPREVLTPLGGIDGPLIQIHHPEAGLAGLGLMA